jgi:Fe-S-cluster-containing hydrogenase component 2
MLDFTGILPGHEGITFRKEKCTGTDKWLYSYRDSYKASKEERDWLHRAKKNKTYIIYMNGDVAKVKCRTKVRPGCEIVVPQKAISRMTTTETMALGTGVASIATMIATIANLMK